ncbi:amidase [Bordetella genomosp. 4]|uniref:amidase n=1 Tax=Bordetella genomosp. 4 TaxID=463044 RepID=UPI000B9E2316|nr:amidase [Bordetella genomosp. 4]OZI51295.1 amidase [Bordetella genomosp. 4]
MNSLSDAATLPFDDTVGAWVPHGRFSVAPTGSGLLNGLSFAAKDLFDVADHRTGAGNPSWLDTHEPATAHSPLVAQLLSAGATLHGKTLTDELAYSIQGENVHYGTPLNTRAPDRVPGGSSSGSASAVAAGLVDFALGTDTGGSTRVPGSYCGLWGLRTTHGLLSAEGVVPLSPMFDTMTWLASRTDVFQRVGEVLMPGSNDIAWRGAVVLTDACAQADAAFAPLIDKVTDTLHDHFALPISHAPTSDTELEIWRQTYVTVSAYDAWQTHKDWITTARPTFGAAIEGRWQAAANISTEAATTAQSRQAGLREQIRTLLGADRIAILPSASSAAISLTADPATVDTIRANTFRITSIAGLAGLPQVNIPFIGEDGLPAGVSLLGPAGSDLALIRLAVAVGQQLSALGTRDA